MPRAVTGRCGCRTNQTGCTNLTTAVLADLVQRSRRLKRSFATEMIHPRMVTLCRTHTKVAAHVGCPTASAYRVTAACSPLGCTFGSAIIGAVGLWRFGASRVLSARAKPPVSRTPRAPGSGGRATPGQAPRRAVLASETQDRTPQACESCLSDRRPAAGRAGERDGREVCGWRSQTAVVNGRPGP
jgi:hypothetical protein